MLSRFLSAILMGALLLALADMLYEVTIERGAVALSAPWAIWLVGLALVAAVALRTPSPRHSWGLFSAVNGGMSWALAAIVSTQPLPEWAPYREGLPLDRVDLSLPVGAFLGGALLSGYMGIATVIIGVILTIAAIWLLSTHNHSNHHEPPHNGNIIDVDQRDRGPTRVI